MQVSVIIPCFNEKNTITKIIEKVENASVILKEIIIVDDFSTDGTREILERVNNPIIKIYFHPKNKGKGAALKTGFSKVNGDICIIQDADLEYDPIEYPKLIKPIIDNKADVVFGSRFKGDGAHRVVYFWHRLGNGFLTFLSNLFSNINLSDMETCYKVFRKEVIQSIRIKENRFGIEPEITAKVAKNNFRIYEVGISYYGRTYSEGKKITWKDGIIAIYCIIKYNMFD